jgi:hypothetical protein
MATIVDSIEVRVVVAEVAALVHQLIGPVHPKSTQTARGKTEAQHHIVDVFVRALLETWATKDGPQLADAVLVGAPAEG